MASAALRPATWLSIAASLCIAVGAWFDGALPARERLGPQMSLDPMQVDLQGAPAFAARRGGVDYRVQPVADYEISGLVVSMHHSDAWWDWIHAASNDHLNVVDLCVVWGANAADGAYERMKFSSGQFVCYVSTNDPSAWKPQYVRALSNNHLLTDDPRIAKLLAGVRIGDQVRLKGQLVEYSHNHGFAFTRGTSVTRDDQGNGACETIFVRQAEVVRRAAVWPRMLMWLGAIALALAVALWFRAPHVSHEG